MHRLAHSLRSAFAITAPLAALTGAAAWAGCSDDPAADPADAATSATDSGADTGQVDAGDDTGPAKRDCKADEDVTTGLVNHLECTGLYEDIASKKLAPGVKAYKPGLEFWSDGAEKSRYVLIPAGTKIDTSNFDEWKFPNGFKTWKEFRIGGRIIETRIYEKVEGAWRHTVYRWNNAETEAVRLETGALVANTGQGAVYEVPNTTQCNQCHNGRTEPILGFEAILLSMPTATGITLASLVADGLLTNPPPSTSLALPDGMNGTAAAALGWLHVNCGACHNANPTADAVFTNLRFLVRPSQLHVDAGAGTSTPATVEELDAYTTSWCVDSSRTDLDAGAPYKRIRGGAPTQSLGSILSGARVPVGQDPSSSVQMPPLVTRRVDTAGHALLDAWINELPPCP